MFNRRRSKTLTVGVGKARRSIATFGSSPRFVPGRSVRGRPSPLRPTVILPHCHAGGNLFLGAPVCRSGARTGADVLFLRWPQSLGIGSAAVGKKMEGKKWGPAQRAEGAIPFFVVPGFCFFRSGFWSSGLFSGPGFRRRTTALTRAYSPRGE